MHILFVADGDDKYGAPHSLFQMVSELLKIDNAIRISVIVTKNSELAQSYSKLGCGVYRIPYSPFIVGMPTDKWKLLIRYPKRGLAYLFGRWYGVRLLEKQFDMNTVDIIHANSSREDFAAQLAQKYKKPLIWHIREFGDLDYKCYSYRKDNIALMNRSAEKCIAISDAVRQHWIQKGIIPQKIVRIYNGVDSEIRKKTDYAKDGRRPIRFVIMGSISEVKGQRQVVEAVGLLFAGGQRNLTVDIIGSGDPKYSRALELRIKELGLEAVIRMKGYQRDFYKNLAAYDCGIMCSRSEGFGRVTAEYMMAGLPVIASDTGANPELVEDGKNGLLYRLNDANDLADKMLAVMKHPELLEQMGHCAADYASKNLTAKRNAEQVYEIYKEVLQLHGNE